MDFKNEILARKKPLLKKQKMVIKGSTVKRYPYKKLDSGDCKLTRTMTEVHTF